MRRQLGDGCALITGPSGKSAIIGLAEFKAGFDRGLLDQVFARSDARSQYAVVEFRGTDNVIHTRTLTREFSFNNAKKDMHFESLRFTFMAALMVPLRRTRLHSRSWSRNRCKVAAKCTKCSCR